MAPPSSLLPMGMGMPPPKMMMHHGGPVQMAAYRPPLMMMPSGFDMVQMPMQMQMHPGPYPGDMGPAPMMLPHHRHGQSLPSGSHGGDERRRMRPKSDRTSR
jgi:hypothetical protein